MKCAAYCAPADAEALLADGFTDIKTEVLRDPYAITDHRDLLHYLRSLPPASDASEDQLEQRETLIMEKCTPQVAYFTCAPKRR